MTQQAQLQWLDESDLAVPSEQMIFSDIQFSSFRAAWSQSTSNEIIEFFL
jgi:hypothetical protein